MLFSLEHHPHAPITHLRRILPGLFCSFIAPSSQGQESAHYPGSSWRAEGEGDGESEDPALAEYSPTTPISD